jgi:hypothetical protein
MGAWLGLAGWKRRRTASGSIPPQYAEAAAPVTDDRPRLSMAFAGAAYGWPYYCGVAWFVQKHDLLRQDARFYCCSAGNVGGLYLTAGIDAEKDGLEVCMAANESHTHPVLGPWLRPEKARAAFFGIFAQLLPEDAHVRASGRLHVLVTQLLPVLRQRVVSQFASRRALLSVMAASMSIPGHGVRFAYRDDEALDFGWCLDGGVLGTLRDDERPGWETVRVSALPTLNVAPMKKVHIGPRPWLDFRDLFTIRSRAERRALHARGYEDAARYFEQRLGKPAAANETVDAPALEPRSAALEPRSAAIEPRSVAIEPRSDVQVRSGR